MDDKQLAILLGAAPAPIHSAVVEKTLALLDLFCDKTGKEIPLPSFSYDLRGKRAGQADLANHKITLNIELLLDPEHYDEQINQTLGHELAHLIHYKLFPGDREWHGPRWKYVMTLLDLDPEMYHNMPVKPMRKTRKFRYYCPCGNIYRIGLNRHKKIQSGRDFECTNCHTLCYDMDWEEETES